MSTASTARAGGLKLRPLGGSGFAVAPLALGGNVFGWTADEATSFALLDAFVERGFNLVDTADAYSAWVPGHRGGESETLIGRWLAARPPSTRDRIVLATKVGWSGGLGAAHIRAACEASLRRLQTDRIDLYQSHKDDPVTPVEEPLEAYAALIAAGKVRAIGASNFSRERLDAALAASSSDGLPRYETLQPLHNLYDRAAYEAELEPLARDRGLGVIPYFGLARGFLTGKYRSEADLGKSPRGEGVKAAYFNPRGFAILAALDEVAQAVNATPAQVALAWQMARPGITAPIASATSVKQLEELMAAATLVLDPASLAALDRASA